MARRAATRGAAQLARGARRARRQGVSALQAAVAREENVLAYNDVFLLICGIALVTALWISAHTLYNIVMQVPSPFPAPAPAPSPLPRLPVTDTVTD